MDVLHYINVLIGFSLVMLVLSSVVGATAQAIMILFGTRARAVGDGLVNLLLEFQFAKDESIKQVTSLFQRESTDMIDWIFNLVAKLVDTLVLFYSNTPSIWANVPKNISREEFLLLLLRKATGDDVFAKKLGFIDKTDAYTKLKAVEEDTIKNETAKPSSPAYLWATEAMQKNIPSLAGKLFSRFDNIMDRVDEKISRSGKFLSILVTLPLLFGYCPIDSVELISRLNTDKVLSEKLAVEATSFINKTDLQDAETKLKACQTKRVVNQNIGSNSANNQEINKCDNEEKEVKRIFGDEKVKLSGLIGLDLFAQNNECKEFNLDCLNANFKFGILLTWIFVSMGSAFWLGILNKMIGIRSEFSRKLADQRESRATQQNSPSEQS